MQHIRASAHEYWRVLEERAGASHVSRPFQFIGLNVAGILGDHARKSLYIKFAKEYDGEKLLELAKSIAERPEVRNKGAYFMKVVRFLPRRRQGPKRLP